LKPNTGFLTSHRNSPSFLPSLNPSLHPHRCLLAGGRVGGAAGSSVQENPRGFGPFSRGITAPATLRSPKPPSAEPPQPRDAATSCPESTQSPPHIFPHELPSPKSPPTTSPKMTTTRKSPQDIAFLHTAFLL